jgi:CheY-like chemotaxis protein
MTNPGRILVVEDFAALRTLIVSILEEKGHEIFEAASVDEGIQAATGDALDLLICDNRLPGGGSGADVAAAAVLHHPDLRVLFISARPSPGATWSIDGVHTAFLAKPFRIEELIDAVADLLALPPVTKPVT